MAARRDRWSARPGAATAARIGVLVVPALLGAVVSWALARALPAKGSWPALVAQWLLLLGVATATVVAVERVARRLLPLAFLLDLSLLFPGDAPSRFTTALRGGSTRRLDELIERAEHEDEDVGAARTVLALAAALSGHDRKTRGHSERVRAYAELIGAQMGLDERRLDRLRWAALLHDVGKLRVPEQVLNKSGPLDDDEWALVRRHPEAGARLVRGLASWLEEAAPAIAQHHERWDGRGYPAGLSGDAIALPARIVAVADAYEVMTSRRSYKASTTASEAREELATCAGAHFDPRVVRAFLDANIRPIRQLAAPLAWLSNLPLVRGLPAFSGQTAATTTGGVALALGVALAGGEVGLAPGAGGAGLSPTAATADADPAEAQGATGATTPSPSGRAAEPAAVPATAGPAGGASAPPTGGTAAGAGGSGTGSEGGRVPAGAGGGDASSGGQPSPAAQPPPAARPPDPEPTTAGPPPADPPPEEPEPSDEPVLDLPVVGEVPPSELPVIGDVPATEIPPSDVPVPGASGGGDEQLGSNGALRAAYTNRARTA